MEGNKAKAFSRAKSSSGDDDGCRGRRYQLGSTSWDKSGRYSRDSSITLTTASARTTAGTSSPLAWSSYYLFTASVVHVR